MQALAPLGSNNLLQGVEAARAAAVQRPARRWGLGQCPAAWDPFFRDGAKALAGKHGGERKAANMAGLYLEGTCLATDRQIADH